MARRILEALRRSRSISSEEEMASRAAALLHDVTHIPFGHTLEDERRVLPRHDEDPSRFHHFFVDSPLGATLRREGIHDEVLRILRGDAGFASDMIMGPITADLLDYLRRDTYFTGLSQFYDPRVFQSFIIENGRLVINLEKHGMLRRDSLSELVNLLRLRYTLSERVYFHHAKIASGAMISKAVELALGSGLAVEELWRLKDDTLIWVLRERFGSDPAIAHLVECLESRRIYRPSYVETKPSAEIFHYDPGVRDDAERRIAETSGLQPHQVIIYCPAPGMSLPEAEVLVRLEDGRIVPLSGSNNDEIRVLKEKHKALWKCYVLLDRGVGPQQTSQIQQILRNYP
jgi:HD superfamily phosphohydrolase